LKLDGKVCVSSVVIVNFNEGINNVVEVFIIDHVLGAPILADPANIISERLLAFNTIVVTVVSKMVLVMPALVTVF
jgi:hypothetical protein